jgi:hypothetical protein
MGVGGPASVLANLAKFFKFEEKKNSVQEKKN